MKKLLIFSLCALMVLSLAACAAGDASDSAGDNHSSEAFGTSGAELEAAAGNEADAPSTITITTLNADKESIQLEVPYNPQRVAVMDLAVLDMIDNFGFGERVVGVSKGSSIDYLQSYIADETIRNLGTIKEASLEAVMECEPDIIFIGGRLSSQYDAFAEIAPVVFLATDVEAGLINSVASNAKTVASIFGVEDQVDGMIAAFDERIAALQAVAEGRTAFVGMLNAGGFNVLGNDGRCSIIGVEVGFDNIGLDAEKSERADGDATVTITSTHGNETSFEYIVRLDPDYIFVMNRDDAIGTEGAQTAQEVIENELIEKTAAYQNGNIVYLQYSNVWYTAEGGITALDYMLRDLESALLG